MNTQLQNETNPREMTLEEYLEQLEPLGPIDVGTGKLLSNGQVYFESNGQPYWSVPKVEVIQ